MKFSSCIHQSCFWKFILNSHWNELQPVIEWIPIGAGKPGDWRNYCSPWRHFPFVLPFHQCLSWSLQGQPRAWRWVASNAGKCHVKIVWSGILQMWENSPWKWSVISQYFWYSASLLAGTQKNKRKAKALANCSSLGCWDMPWYTNNLVISTFYLN